MKAIVLEKYGEPDVLHEAEAGTPEPGPTQVRVRVRAAGLNQVDAKTRSGLLKAMRPLTFPAILGGELAGVVDAVGAERSDLQVGDEVLGWSDTGAYAEYALATMVAPKPAGLSWAAAAALPVAGGTTEKVFDLLDLRSGETVLFHGASGGVGTVAVQVAVARGLTVVATAGASNQEYLSSLGAVATTYGDGLVGRVEALAPQGIDAVFDLAGKGALEDSIALRGGTDRIVTIADLGAQQLGVTFAGGSSQSSPEHLAALARDVAEGTVATTVTTFTLGEAAQAHVISEAGHARGKLVLLVD